MALTGSRTTIFLSLETLSLPKNHSGVLKKENRSKGLLFMRMRTHQTDYACSRSFM